MKTSFSGIFFGFICMGVGCFFLAGTWGAYLDYNRVQEYSGRASGHVTKKYFQMWQPTVVAITIWTTGLCLPRAVKLAPLVVYPSSSGIPCRLMIIWK